MKSPIVVNPDKCVFTSDTHFGHRKLLEYEEKYRQYKDADEMDEGIITIWNSQVEPDDIVFHLGDFSFHTIGRTADIIDRLNGRIVLIYGNHDDHIRKGARVTDKLLLAADYLYQKIEDEKVMMMHFPIFNWRDQRHGSIHLHGHKHGNPTGIQGKTADMGFDVAGKLFRWQEVKQMMTDKTAINHHD